MAIVNAERLRPDVLITALASRLADLQNSRIEGDSDASISAPTTAPDAGRRALVAGFLLSSLEGRIETSGTGFVPINLLHDQLTNCIPNLSIEELRFVARFLDVDREIRYQEISEGSVEERVTRGWSRLIRYQARFDRVKLTDAGRLWIRVLRHREHWLFEDKEIEKLLVSIRSGLFEQIPPIASETVTSIRLFSETLTSIIESPSFDELVRQYAERREYFSGVIERCHVSVVLALELLQTEAIAEAHERWQQLHNAEAISVSRLYEYVSRVHRATESLRRSWAALLDMVLQDRRPMIGILRFDAAIDRYIADPPIEAVDRILLDGIAGWGNGAPLFASSDIIGTLPAGIEPETPSGPSFDCDMSPARRQIRSWLAANRTVLLQTLNDGAPKRIFDLFDAGVAPSLSTLAAAFGVYVIADPLGGRHRIMVEQQGHELLDRTLDGHRVRASDVTIRLAGKTIEASA